MNVELTGPDPEKTRQLQEKTRRVKLKKDQLDNPPDDVVPGSIEPDDRGRIWARKRIPRHPEYQALSASSDGKGFSGFAIEVGEPQTHGSYEKFKQSVLEKARIDADALAEGRVEYTGTRGNRVEIRANDPLDQSPTLRNGTPRSFDAPWAKYRNADPDKTGPVHQDWGGGSDDRRGGRTPLHLHRDRRRRRDLRKFVRNPG